MALPASPRERPTPAPPTNVQAESPVPTHVAGLQGYGVVALAVVIIVGALYLAQGFFVPIAVALVAALALARIVRGLGRIMPRWLASAVVVSVLVAMIAALAYSLSDEAARAVAELPRATRNMRQALRVMTKADHGALSQLQRALGELQRTATESTERPSTPSGVTPVQVIEPPVDFTNVMWLGSQGVLLVAGQLALILFLVYFLLAYGDLFKLKLVRISGGRLSQRRVTVQLIDQIGESVQRSISHLVIASLVVGLVTWGAMRVMHVNYAGLWGLVAGLMNFVPYVGPAIVAVGLFFATVLQWGDIPVAAGVAGVSMVITTLEGFLFTPIVFGHAVRLNPVAIFIAFLFWGWLWGIWGMLLAMPLLMIMKTVSDSVEGLAPLSELLSD